MKPSRRAVSVETLEQAAYDSVIDVRSPSEFAEDHVPGAVSCPVLDDAERARIGTVHKQVSSFEAKRVGAALVARNIARYIETTFADKPQSWRPLVYCWRGGKRSAAMAQVLREIGWDVNTLEGGYKAYRRHVVDRLAKLPPKMQLRVVHGVTGSGKSRLLRALSAVGAQVLDLEALAVHRGSVLGELPGRPQPSQKRFESLLLERLAALQPTQPIYVEGESRKIGQLQVPEALIHAMREAPCLVVEADCDTRIALLMEEYRHFFTEPAALDSHLECLVPLHGRAHVEEWKALAARAAWRELVARLLAEHYDPAYRRSAARNYVRLGEATVVRVEAPWEEAFTRIAQEMTASSETILA